MKVLLVGNLSDRRCGFQNFTQQMLVALTRAGHAVTPWDGTYAALHARTEAGQPDFFPEDVQSYDVVHVIWNAMTLNHYSGAPWASLVDRSGDGPVISWWDGGPSDASCPFLEHMQVRWSDYPREGYHYSPYPVPDWVEDLPEPPARFTVGVSTVRGDGVPEIRELCHAYGWALNLPVPGTWLSIDDEIRRLARSTVNVCWYNTPPLWHNRASAPSMLLAAGRPLLINQDPLVAHLWDYGEQAGIYHGVRHPLVPGVDGPGLEECLVRLADLSQRVGLWPPLCPADDLSWSRAVDHFVQVWKEAR